MKKLVMIAALVAAPAFADTWEMPNQSGGRIVLQETTCFIGGKKYNNLRSMFAASGAGKTFSGCWYFEDGWVHVIYNDGTEYTYPASSFTHLQSAKPKGTSL